MTSNDYPPLPKTARTSLSSSAVRLPKVSSSSSSSRSSSLRSPRIKSRYNNGHSSSESLKKTKKHYHVRKHKRTDSKKRYIYEESSIGSSIRTSQLSITASSSSSHLKPQAATAAVTARSVSGNQRSSSSCCQREHRSSEDTNELRHRLYKRRHKDSLQCNNEPCSSVATPTEDHKSLSKGHVRADSRSRGSLFSRCVPAQSAPKEDGDHFMKKLKRKVFLKMM
eukprot:GHVH01003745.1.p1 GENE.GHVH01003745.1~~GHVH01003745.1.p1  ORF type:complete len:224 (+),score=18.93 GHVH01003745.1:476-1147(+)